MFTIDPPPCSRITGSTACEQKKVPYRSISITLFHALPRATPTAREVARRVVDEQVDAPVLPPHLRDHLLHALGLAHVHRHAARLAAGGADLRRGRLHTLQLAAGQHDVRAKGRERVGDAAADAAAAAGDQRDLTIEQAGTKDAERQRASVAWSRGGLRWRRSTARRRRAPIGAIRRRSMHRRSSIERRRCAKGERELRAPA